GHTVEKPQRTHDLIERRPGYPDRHQVDLEGADILQLKTIGGPTEIPAQLRYRGKVGSLRRWRQIADRHVLNHAAEKRAHLGHLITSWLSGGLQHPHPLRQEALRATSPSRRGSGFVQSRICCRPYRRIAGGIDSVVRRHAAWSNDLWLIFYSCGVVTWVKCLIFQES